MINLIMYISLFWLIYNFLNKMANYFEGIPKEKRIKDILIFIVLLIITIITMHYVVTYTFELALKMRGKFII